MNKTTSEDRYGNKQSLIRKIFRTHDTKPIEIPCLISLQIESYKEFLQKDILPENRKDIGMQSALKEAFPISNPLKTVQIDFISYHISEPYYNAADCKSMGLTYAGNLKLTLEIRQIHENETKVRHEDVYIGEIPLMTENGMFIVNGCERVVVSQLHRSPGIFFEQIDRDIGHSYLGRIIPTKGPWLDFEIDEKSNLFALINKKRIQLVQLILALCEESIQNISPQQQILEATCPDAKLLLTLEDDHLLINEFKIRPQFDILLEDKITQDIGLDKHKKQKKYIKKDLIFEEYIFNDLTIGSITYPAGTMITQEILDTIPNKTQITIVNKNADYSEYIVKSILQCKIYDKSLIATKIASLVKPNEQVKNKTMQELIEDSFFNPNKYNLSEIGRAKLNYKLNLDLKTHTLTKEDIIAAIKYILSLANGDAEADHPDNLMHRRIRAVGELVYNQFHQSIIKMSKSMQDKLMSNITDINLCEIVNSRHFASSIREFFCTSQLSQLADSTNLLSSLSHKRRISAFGPGGLNKDRTLTSMRNLDPTHYGRICFNETPEGHSVGLINSMTILSKVDKYGFISTPYKKVENGKITDEIVFMSPIQEVGKVIAHYDKNIINDNNEIYGDLIDCRKNNEHYTAKVNEIDFIDVSPMQIISLSSSLIPFIENCDSVRVVMGSNMQRQALPLVKPTAALIGTGMESIAVRDSGSSIMCKNSGEVIYVSASHIIVKTDDAQQITDTYHLTKFDRSNDSTLIDQKPSVSVGDKVKKGDMLAIGSAIEGDEIALGRNLKIAFLSWKGYNYEDAVVISSRVTRDFRSIGLAKFEVLVREVKQGVEEITREIPNITEHKIAHLDESGIVNLGAHVKAGDTLVGKATPKAEITTSASEKLVRAIFGTKSVSMDDTSLRVPPRVKGTVVGVKIFSKRGIDKNKRMLEIEREMIQEYTEDRDIQLKALNNSFRSIVSSALEFDSNIGIEKVIEIAEKSDKLEKVVNRYRAQKISILNDFKQKCDKTLEGNTLPTGVLQMIQVFIATEYTIQVGDKIAGRHGNKGIISKVVNPEDMPYTEDGEPVDIILTSTGISGRMNIGQILEAHLGWASLNLGKKIKKFIEQIKEKHANVGQLRSLLLSIYDSPEEQKNIKSHSDEYLISFAKRLQNGVPFGCPVFDGPKRERIKELLELAGCDPSGKEYLYDGQTGERFPQKVTVGVLYIMQLHHLIDKKEHARSVGPYSIITQQPLGGRAQMGGQRLGEMECWALQAHSASYTAREMLTVKSDYTAGRARVFQLISQGYDVMDLKGIPSSFSVLIYELRALCLNVECLKFRNGQFTTHAINTIDDFDALKICIADADQIREWSYGEVKKPETIHYRTYKPHPDGMFSTKIFGPIKDHQCLCGKHKGYRKKGVICSRCHTEVTSSIVRRYRMGHIELAAPVVHVWFAKVLPSRISIALDMSTSNLNRILRLEYYAITRQGLAPKPVGSVISEHEFIDYNAKYEDTGFKALTGAEAIESLLKNVNIGDELADLKETLKNTSNSAIREKALKRLKLLESFQRNGAKLESMVLRVIGVLPPDLRPLVAIDGNRFASSDLNDLYRRVINRNNRLAKMLTYITPSIILKNEKRMLQEAVDALLDNSRRSQPVIAANKRPLKSLTDIIKGKQGRFRQNLLGKRVDYSGRSVIVVGPYLKLHQCGLPKGIALELFRPFVLSRLILRGFASHPKAAKRMIDNKQEEVWSTLYEVTKDHIVLLNRAPTLHRLGIQAFEPILVEGKAIHLHPLTCRAFNADFDGDQMGLHISLSIESQLEARVFMMSTKCILSPANGSPIATPSKDMILGIYAMTTIEPGFKSDNLKFGSFDEVEHAYSLDIIRYSTPISFLINGALVETTYGRIKLYNSIPKYSQLTFDDVNQPIVSKILEKIVYQVYIEFGEKHTAEFLDKIMQYGFEYATKCGATFAYSDLPVPENKKEIIAETNKSMSEYFKQYTEGLILREDLYNKRISGWTECTERLSANLMEKISKHKVGEMMNPIYMMSISGARGSALQIRQLSAMRGIIAKSDGSLHESPIVNSFIEGVNVREYMIGSQGARKSLADIAFKTADSGYLTRRLAAVAQDVSTQTEDCNTEKYIIIKIEQGNPSPVSERVFGRTAAEDIYDDENQIITKKNEIIDQKMCELIDKSSITRIKIRSPITCEGSGWGICCKCYGYDMSTLKKVKTSVAVGIIAAQSIGEPGTQLTMKNFQAGGAAQNIMGESKAVSISSGTLRMIGVKQVELHGKNIVISKNNIIELVDHRGHVVTEFRIPQGSTIYFANGDMVKKSDIIAEWDLYMSHIIAEKTGRARFRDIVVGISCREVVDILTGMKSLIITKTTNRICPTIIIESETDSIEYPLQSEDVVEVSSGKIVQQGAIIAQRIKNVAKTQDIIGGLEKIVDLFEARRAKNPCVLSPISGHTAVKHSHMHKKIQIVNESTKKECLIHKNSNIIVTNGDFVRAGDHLTDGKICMHELLKVKGEIDAARWIINEVQNVYTMQAIKIAEKHIEIIVRQMLKYGVIVEPGDTKYSTGEIIARAELDRINEILSNQGRKLLEYSNLITGITKAAIADKDSFLSAASFQETAKVLIEAAIQNEIDPMEGLKVNMMTGKQMPIGVGSVIRKIKDQDKMLQTVNANRISQRI